MTTLSAMRRGFTLLEVALAVAVIVTLAAASMIALRASSDNVTEAGTNQNSDYLDVLSALLDEASIGGTTAPGD